MRGPYAFLNGNLKGLSGVLIAQNRQFATGGNTVLRGHRRALIMYFNFLALRRGVLTHTSKGNPRGP